MLAFIPPIFESDFSSLKYCRPQVKVMEVISFALNLNI